jgi:hypothetical protein
MSRIVVIALLVAALAAALLLQLERGAELWMWEVLLAVVVVWLARGVPTGGSGTESRLFVAKSMNPIRLPRAVSATEMAVVDALAGNLGRDQRVRPVLERIAVHRLQRHGVDLDSPAAMTALGEEQWRWLTGREAALRPGELEQLVSHLENL